MRHHFAQAVLQRQQAVNAKQDLGEDLARARKVFFATASKPEARAEAEKRFADLLLSKDYSTSAG